jgi:prepilin-type processing-associated H-X9-DG protein
MATVDGANDPLDGWAPILDRDKLLPGKRDNGNSVMVCRQMLDYAGTLDGQTGSDPGKPKGWMEWPTVRANDGSGALTGFMPITIPDRGFTKIIRVGYWINADNPIGSSKPLTQSSHYTSTGATYYTTSAGYGPDVTGKRMRLVKASQHRRAASLIALADGLYAGKQASNQIFVKDSRIGYRHPPVRAGAGGGGTANALFADGHVEPLPGNRFPRALGAPAPYLPAGAATPTADQIKAENLGANPTIYADPVSALP